MEGLEAIGVDQFLILFCAHFLQVQIPMMLINIVDVFEHGFSAARALLLKTGVTLLH